ncbi:RNA polymerase sigma factor [Rathayibacter sp. VKM Ac-2928]|uniref:RNA polymerase sigma factor n=1 Tax=Rathayibacter sp. VKM Ac-2928 TaxID=2929479 RepID=UPI001FB35A6B|nr:RNA polymerase sigma factor [Rathayibacter sp. VKM Ac-2928]MCJ1685369.1 RNA polymerase sigma factor [Rathayibacter sp. VKM Ac-2928]
MSDVSSDSGDQQLLAAVLDGNRLAFKLVWNRYAPLIYRYAASRVGAPDLREDITQEVFLTFWQKRMSIIIYGETLAPWLIATAAYHIQNQNRTQTRITRVTAKIAANLNTNDKSQPSAESDFFDQEFARALHDALSQLPSIDQKLYILCHRDGVTYAEAARRLQISHGAVRNRLLRMRNRLRATLSAEI